MNCSGILEKKKKYGNNYLDFVLKIYVHGLKKIKLRENETRISGRWN
jgi:hypothetical protein